MIRCRIFWLTSIWVAAASWSRLARGGEANSAGRLEKDRPASVVSGLFLSGQRPGSKTNMNTATAVVAVGGPTAAVSRVGKRKRLWDRSFLASLRGAAPGMPMRFELLGGELASGTLLVVKASRSEATYVSGRLTQPEAGRFFFHKQGMAGTAGEFIGVVEFPGSNRAYRIEPTGPEGAPELVERPLEEVLCINLPRPAESGWGLRPKIPPLNPAAYPDLPIPPYQNGIVTLQSLPGAQTVIYLDFQGGYTDSWGGIAYARPDMNNAQIREVWQRMAEHFMPFNINVTTDLSV